jgi:hypothetical protein
MLLFGYFFNHVVRERRGKEEKVTQRSKASREEVTYAVL